MTLSIGSLGHPHRSRFLNHILANIFLFWDRFFVVIGTRKTCDFSGNLEVYWCWTQKSDFEKIIFSRWIFDRFWRLGCLFDSARWVERNSDVVSNKVTKIRQLFLKTSWDNNRFTPGIIYKIFFQKRSFKPFFSRANIFGFLISDLKFACLFWAFLGFQKNFENRSFLRFEANDQNFVETPPPLFQTFW